MMPSLEKNEFEFLYIIQTISFFGVCGYGCEKKQQPKKCHNVIYVVMFGDGRGPTHCNAHT
jgi:hypothetical protein